jgi:DNA-binding MarR family transcriptional regulator
MGTRSADGPPDSEIFEAMAELGAALLARGEQVAQRFGLPAFGLKALHALASPMAMRDLGRVLHCDPSFVTTIADLLEKRGLARREASPADRRSKNLVLTDEGAGLRAEVEREFMARMPWHCLDAEERTCLLRLIRKMIRAESTESAATPPTAGGQRAGEVSKTPISGSPGS